MGSGDAARKLFIINYKTESPCSGERHRESSRESPFLLLLGPPSEPAPEQPPVSVPKEGDRSVGERQGTDGGAGERVS